MVSFVVAAVTVMATLAVTDDETKIFVLWRWWQQRQLGLVHFCYWLCESHWKESGPWWWG